MDNKFALSYQNSCPVTGDFSGPPVKDENLEKNMPNIGTIDKMSTSAPERSLITYSTTKAYPANRVSFVESNSHTRTLVGMITQLERITGPDFFRIDNYGKRAVRIPLLENLFLDSKSGKKLLSISELRADREPFNKGTGWRKEFGELAYFYLHLILVFHLYGSPFIKELAPYSEVKRVLLDYWDILVRPEGFAQESMVFCKKILGHSSQGKGHDRSIQFDREKEKGLVKAVSVCMESLEDYHMDHSPVNQRRVPEHLQKKSSFTCQNLLNLMHDFLCLNSGVEPVKVIGSLPKDVVDLFNLKFGKPRLFTSDSGAIEERATLQAGGLRIC